MEASPRISESLQSEATRFGIDKFLLVTFSLFQEKKKKKKKEIKIHNDMKKQINAKQIWKVSKTNRGLKYPDAGVTGRGFIPSSGVSLLWPRCQFEEDKVLLCCCCKLPFSLHAIVHVVHCAAC